jgi:hypothetical protein
VPNGSTIPERHPHAQLRVIVNWCYIAIALFDRTGLGQFSVSVIAWLQRLTPLFVDPPSPRGRETTKGHPITLLASSRYMRTRRRASAGSMTRNQNIVLRLRE